MQAQEILQEIQNDRVSSIVMSMMGVDRLAYVKPSASEGFTVYAADGTALADFDCMNEAFESIARHNLTPVRIH